MTALEDAERAVQHAKEAKEKGDAESLDFWVKVARIRAGLALQQELRL